ncbi:MAG: hypothetical protein JO225_09120 [Candidatus Eremiobacteraeota bacterium]|nr:hypothetical protein [Candidatus Eremiobacteraeota bacterium]
MLQLKGWRKVHELFGDFVSAFPKQKQTTPKEALIGAQLLAQRLKVAAELCSRHREREQRLEEMPKGLKTIRRQRTPNVNKQFVPIHRVEHTPPTHERAFTSVLREAP